MTPHSPEAQKTIDEAAARARARLESGAYLDAPSLFTRARIDLGWSITSERRAYAEGDQYPIGGLVIEKLPAYDDPTTGEIVPARFRVFDRYRMNSDSRGYNTLTIDEVDEAQIQWVRSWAWAGAVALLGRVNTKRRVAHPRDVEAIHDALVLAAESAAL
jgi:hypothetical protein